MVRLLLLILLLIGLFALLFWSQGSTPQDAVAFAFAGFGAGLKWFCGCCSLGVVAVAGLAWFGSKP